jgi:hypothetical protein
VSLFICPCCGYADAPIWRTSRFAVYQVQCTFDEFSSFFPELAQKMLVSPDGWLFEKPYWYKLTNKKNRVYRMTEMGKAEFQTHGFTENPHRDRHNRKSVNICLKKREGSV